MLHNFARGSLARGLTFAGIATFGAGWLIVMLGDGPIRAFGYLLAITGILAASLGLYVIGALQRLALIRAIQDRPTARIATASQGYHELSGVARSPGQTIRCPVCGAKVLWYIGDGTRFPPPPKPWPPIVLDDGTGLCLIHTRGAEVFVQISDKKPHMHIAAGDRLHVLGELRSLSAAALKNATAGEVPVADSTVARAALVAQKLTALKKDRRAMATIDTNQDGTVSYEEWQVARKKAEADVARELTDAPPDPHGPTHVLMAPATNKDRLPFVIMIGDEQEALKRARIDMAMRMFMAVAVSAVASFILVAVEGDRSLLQYRRAKAPTTVSAASQTTAREAPARRELSEFDQLRRRDYELARAKRWDEIIAMWDEYLERNPDDARAYFERAGTKHHSGRREEARADAQQACDLGLEAACKYAR